ncbi:MAG: HigA family addiction module antitoxin [Candidatus Sulfotelmatobacter sp.]
MMGTLCWWIIRITIEDRVMIFNPAHPGEVLKEYLGELSIREAADRLGVTRAHLSRILNGHAGITAQMSLRLSGALGTSPEFWLKMQVHHDLWQAQRAKPPKVRRFPHVIASGTLSTSA